MHHSIRQIPRSPEIRTKFLADHTVRCYEDDLTQFEGYLIEISGEGRGPDVWPTPVGSEGSRPG